MVDSAVEEARLKGADEMYGMGSGMWTFMEASWDRRDGIGGDDDISRAVRNDAASEGEPCSGPRTKSRAING